MPRDDAWRRIRALRSRPPALAALEPGRRSVFGAALQQGEELFDAAAVVGDAAKPLPLFYALSQAGRAIAAAYNPTSGWQITGHGLTLRSEGGDIRSAVVTPRPHKNGSDAYRSVAHAIGSDVLRGSVTLSELWAAIPELLDYPHLAGGATRTLEIRPEGTTPDIFPVLHPAMGTVLILDVAGEEELRAHLDRFANTHGCEILVGPLPQVGRVSHATLHWPAEPSPEATPGTKAFRPMYEVAMTVGGRWFLRPLLGTPPAAPDPLLIWWALLLALSSLARYHPDVWTASLDVDAEPSGVELEACLAVVQERMPQLIADVLERASRGSEYKTDVDA